METFFFRSLSRRERMVWRLSLRLEAYGRSSSSLAACSKGSLGLPRDFDDLEELQNVAFLDVVEVLDADAALEALADRAGVVAEALEGAYVALVDHRAVAHQADAVVAEDLAAGDHAAGHDPGVRDAERLAHLCGTRLPLPLLGGEHAAHGGLDLLERLVDHVVGPDLDTLALGDLLGRVCGPDVEPEQ